MVALPRQPGFGEASAALYNLPTRINSVPLRDLVDLIGRETLKDKQLDFLRAPDREPTAYYVGDITILSRLSVSVVGSRKASD
jgi:hypothetical protein